MRFRKTVQIDDERPATGRSSLSALGQARSKLLKGIGARQLIAPVCFAWFAIALVCAQDFRITSAASGPGNMPHIQFETDTNFYYILLRGDFVTNITSATALTLVETTNSARVMHSSCIERQVCSKFST